MRASVDLSDDENVEDALRLHALLDAIDSCPAPVVAQVHGHALGGGAGLVACADVAIAEAETQFAFSEVKLGIVPAVISPFVLARTVPGAPRRYFVTGERFDAWSAHWMGLVQEVTVELERALEDVLAQIAPAGPEATRSAKQLACRAHSAEETARLIAERRASAEGQEGLRAFLEKRAPDWRG
jgi:methylglutaconyl-CoA hydratase